MSEYIEIEGEPTSKPNVFIVHTNLALATDQPEKYSSTSAMEEGSAIAQTLAAVEGLVALEILAHDLLVEHDEDVPWYVIESEITAALKAFFL